MEDVVHHSLECRRWIGKAEEHNRGFKQSFTGFERGFPFIAFFYPDVVVAPLDVQFCINSCPREVMNEVID